MCICVCVLALAIFCKDGTLMTISVECVNRCDSLYKMCTSTKFPIEIQDRGPLPTTSMSACRRSSTTLAFDSGHETWDPHFY